VSNAANEVRLKRERFEVVVTRLVTNTLAYVWRSGSGLERGYALHRTLVTDEQGRSAPIHEGTRLRVETESGDPDRIRFAEIVEPAYGRTGAAAPV
jgi:hypothetical protein